MTTCRKIVNWRTYLRFPPEAEAALTPAARDFIARLLSDVEERLGSHGGAAEIRAHPFFAGLDWGRLYDVRPPYRPAVEHELDTQVGGCWRWVGGWLAGWFGRSRTARCAWCPALVAQVHAGRPLTHHHPPPFLPSRTAPALLQNFEQYEDESAGLTPGGSRSRPIADPNFIGYTYKGWDAVHASGDPGSGHGE